MISPHSPHPRIPASRLVAPQASLAFVLPDFAPLACVGAGVDLAGVSVGALHGYRGGWGGFRGRGNY